MLRVVLPFALACSTTAATAQDKLYIREDFTSETLVPELKIVNRDENRMAFVDGEYLMIVMHPSDRNVVTYEGTLPENFSATVKFMDIPAKDNDQGVQILVGDSERGIGVYAHRWSGQNYDFVCTFDKYLDGERSSFKRERAVSDPPPLYLRIERRGIELLGYCSDIPSWDQPLGPHVVIGDLNDIEVKARIWGEAPESPIRIDYIEIEELD